MLISVWSSDVCTSDLKLTVRFGKFTVQSPVLLFHPLRSRLPPSRSLLLQRKTLMTTHPPRKIGRCVLWFSPVVIVVIGFLARKRVVWGKSVSVRVDLGGRRIIKTKT